MVLLGNFGLQKNFVIVGMVLICLILLKITSYNITILQVSLQQIQKLSSIRGVAIGRRWVSDPRIAMRFLLKISPGIVKND